MTSAAAVQLQQVLGGLQLGPELGGPEDPTRVHTSWVKLGPTLDLTPLMTLPVFWVPYLWGLGVVYISQVLDPPNLQVLKARDGCNSQNLGVLGPPSLGLGQGWASSLQAIRPYSQFRHRSIYMFVGGRLEMQGVRFPAGPKNKEEEMTLDWRARPKKLCVGILQAGSGLCEMQRKTHFWDGL